LEFSRVFLPVLERDLRVRARGKAAYWLRVGVALAGLLVCLPPLLATNPGSPGSDTGKEIFDAVVAAAFVLCCGACLLSADAIGSERRDGTLGLLMLTRVHGFDLLVGKFGASALAGLGAVAAFLPVLMIPILAGGVPAGEAMRKSAALLNTLFFSLAVGLYCSSRTHERFKASMVALGTVGTIIVVPWILSVLAHYFTFFSVVSPLVALEMAADGEFQSNRGLFCGSIALLHLLGWLLLATATLRIDRILRSSRDGVDLGGSALEVRSRRGKGWFDGKTGRNAPVEWLVQSQPGVRPLLWLATSVVISFLGFFWAGFNWVGLALSMTGFWLVYAVCSGGTDAMMAVVAGQFFHNARRAGQLEPLATTPVGARDIVTGQWRALKELLSWPVAVCISAILIHSTFLLNNSQEMMFTRALGWWVAKFFVTWIFDIAVTISGILAMCRLGMWLALRARSRVTVALWAAFLGTGVPALFRLGLSGILQGLVPNLTVQQEAWIVTNWMDELIVVVYYLCLIRFAKTRLERQTSSMAATSGPSFKWRGIRLLASNR
jgi:hypothetical protein